MAETVVGLVVDKLTSLLSSEVNLLRDVHPEIQGIKHHLLWIQAFLKDADARAEAEADSGQVVKLWVDELREVSVQIEIVIDEYAYYVAERKHDRHGLRLISFTRKGYTIASKIRDLKDRVDEIYKMSAAYKFADAGSGSGIRSKTWSDPRDDSCFLRETEVIGIQKEKDEVVTLISGADQHAVVAIVGMGGIGKTTLANQVYEKVKATFDCHAWITVSQTYNKADLLKRLIRGLCKSAEETAPQGIEQETDLLELTKALRNYVQGKNYFMSFDDVWETNFWADIKNGLPSEHGNRGRIVITTRDLKVANVCQMSTSLFICNMDLLNFDDSWKLFCSKAFHSTPGNICPPHLHDLSQAVVRRCEGLPLAIVVIGGLLATKNESIEEWESLVTKFASELESNDSLKSINKILSLSFNDLPYNLKPCLLYFGIFPEDYSIRSGRLIRQWVAEGFVKPEKDKTLEVVAERYLMELINRCIIQASKIDSTGRVKRCRVHDLVRDFIITKMEDLKFCVLLSGNNSDLLRELTTRRLSIRSSDTLDIGSCNVGSVFMFDKGGEMCNPLLAAMTKSFRLLKVLDFEDASSLDHLPEDIGSLYLLRYLSLRMTAVESVPKSIGKLENLETLDLRWSSVRELPSEINMLSKLRNLMTTEGVKLKKGFGCLKSLQKLCWIECGVDTLEELSKLTELRKLGIIISSEDGQALCRCIQSLKQLRTFQVSNGGLLNLESMSSPPEFLRRLYLEVPLTKLPGWVAKLQCLAKIELCFCKLEDNLLEPLQDLPNLLDMKIYGDAYYGEKLRFATGKFKKLEVLNLINLSRLKWLKIEQGSLPNLKEFEIYECPQMKEISGFPHLKTLQVLRFGDLPTEFLLSWDFQSVTSVPDIQFHNYSEIHVGAVQAKHSSPETLQISETEISPSLQSLGSLQQRSETLQRWRDLCRVVKNPKRRFRFTANLTKRFDAAAMRKTNQEKLRNAVLVSQAALQFIQGVQPSECIVPEEVTSAGFQICGDELGSIVQCHDLKKLKSHGGVEGIAKKLSTSTATGLSSDAAALSRRSDFYGLNKFADSQPRGFLVFVWVALHDMTLMILGVCALASLLVGIAMEGWPRGAHDGLGIAASIFLVVFVTATSDYRQSLQFKELDKEKKKISIQVTRNGFRKKMSIYDLLPGDIVHLSIGDQVPADGLFVSGFSVLIDESSLTGESEPVMASSENPFLLSGTKVQDGSCKMLVTTVEMRSQWGKLMATLSEGGDDETPLQVKLNGVATIIGKIGLFFAVVTFAVLVEGLVSKKMQDGTCWYWNGEDALALLEFFAVAVMIVVIAVPEGLPLAVTLSLAFAMKKMMNQKALVRNLAACKTMGSAKTICSDKTGTLTTNRMTVVKYCVGMSVKGVENGVTDLPEQAVGVLLESIFNNTGGEVVVNQDGKREILGTPTETALLDFALSMGGNFQGERAKSKIVKVEPFNSTKKRMGVVIELPSGGLRAHTKGASEIVLANCDKVLNSNGDIVSLDQESISFLNLTIDQFAGEALRTLCLAYVELEGGFSVDSPIPVCGYTCIGIVGIKDPVHPGVKESVRPGVKESVAVCRAAGIMVRMVTRDNINTAKAIARECGILTDDGIAIEGPDFREKKEEELLKLIPKIQVMARSSPLDKHTLVKHLRTNFGEVVAVTGDGTNDAPALHEADIGLAMGIAGIEVAKESADVIMLDDNFTTIATVAKWGHSVYINIQKFVQFQLTVNVVALIVNFSSACLTGSAPLTAVQLLWVNMIMDTLGALALATEPPTDDLMKRTPVGRKGNFISNVMWRNILGQSLYQFAVIWLLQAKGKAMFGLIGHDSELILITLIFNTFVFCQVFNEISSREMEEINVFKGILNNYVFVGVLTCTVVSQIIIVEFLGTFANTSPLTLLQWFFSVFVGFLGMPVAAGVKMIPV